MITKNNNLEIKRKCIVTNNKYNINELLRFVKTKDNQIVLEKDKKILGRGAYCLNEPKTIEILFNKKMLNRAFKQNIDLSVYKKLKEEVEEYVKETKK